MKKYILKCCECESQITTQLHMGESPSKCDNCAGKDSNDRALKDHILPHNVEKPNSGAECEFICKQCQYICNNEDVLINNLKSHNKYLCNKCDFEGKSQHALASHLKIHIQKSFKCPSCDYTCTTFNI